MFPDQEGNLLPGKLPFPNGASTFKDPELAPLSGPYWKIQAGSRLSEGVQIIADGSDINPLSPHGPGHYTIFNSGAMPVDTFMALFANLPWKYGGTK